MNRFFTFLALAGMTSPSAAFMVPKLSATTPTALNVEKYPEKQPEVEPIPDDYVIPAGYVGGFPESKPQYAYPKEQPNLDDLPIMDNMDNIDKLDRMQEVLWPEFSWLTQPGDETSRVYQKFAPNVSRLGYSNDGRVYSIICPQQGVRLPLLGTINVEVTVTGVRGWCNEPEHSFYADMSVVGKVWFAVNEDAPMLLKLLQSIADCEDYAFSKKNAIQVRTHNRFEPWNPIFQVANGTTAEYPIPMSRQHWDENAYGVGHIYVEIGKVIKKNNKKVDELAELIVNIFNLAMGNKLKTGNVLSWNLWMAPPKEVDREEWANHADYWRHSIKVDHVYPSTGEPIHDYVTDYDGNKFSPATSLSQEIASLIHSYINRWKHEKIDDIKDEFKDAFHTIDTMHLFHHHRKN